MMMYGQDHLAQLAIDLQGLGIIVLAAIRTDDEVPSLGQLGRQIAYHRSWTALSVSKIPTDEAGAAKDTDSQIVAHNQIEY
jgi:hypothetical protein